MAKGNMLLGYSRGSVGDVTFYRDGGEQRARARNRKPNNPRSNRQMYQRAKFAGAVKFFKQSLANFYKMAFENKKPNESDYNAFMRVNLAQSPLMSKSAFDKPGYPAIGHWTIAQGSMPTLRFAKNYGTQEDELAVILPVQTAETISNNTTIGEFSTILINSGLYQPGDIFTMVRVIVDADADQLLTLPTATPEGNWNTYWYVTQILLDTSDTRKIGLELLREEQGELIYKNSDGYIYIGDKGNDGISLVTTRNTSNGLKASNSEIVVTDTIDAAITRANSDNYINAVLANWRASGENILQGALAEGYSNPFDRATGVNVSVNAATTNSGSGGSATWYDAEEIAVGQTAVIHNIDNGKPYIRAIQCVYSFTTSSDAAAAEAKVRDAKVTYLNATYDVIAQLDLVGNTLTVAMNMQTPNTSVMQGGIMQIEAGEMLLNVDINYSLYATETGIGGHGQTVPAPGTEEIPLNAPDNSYSYHFKLSAAETLNQNDFILATPTNVGVEVASNISVQQDSGGYHVVEVDYPTAATTGWQVGNTLYLMYKNSPIAKIIVTTAE